MRLTRIEIENFKGIGSRQTIEPRAITLLFGPNSAGKSTILQALHYLREILERGNVDPDVTIAGGLINLGGFATLVHNHELNRAVTLKVAIDLSDEQFPLLTLNNGNFINEPEFSELQVRYLVGENTEYLDHAVVQEIAVAVEVRWSELELSPYVARMTIYFDGEPLAAIISPPQKGRAQLTDFNFAHPLVRRAVLSEVESSEEIDEFIKSPLENEIRSLSREAIADRSSSNTPDDKLRIAVTTKAGALPILEIDLALSLQDSDMELSELENLGPRIYGLITLLSEMVLEPVRIVRDFLSEMTYIGPIRDIPTRNYRPQITPDEARWARGLAAWDLLYNDRSGKLIDEVNCWLTDQTRLSTNYRLERMEFKEVPIPSAFHQMFNRGLNEDDLGDIQELYNSFATKNEIVLRDFEKGILVSPGDIGVGISQMIPVVVGALRKQDGILIIEQPELHVHPSIQVGMGDLFIYATKNDPDRLFSGKSLLIETHSEHIILRLLRRIRESTDNELTPGVIGLKARDLCVIYVEDSKEGVQFSPLDVDDEGEFRDRWPHGFFEERAKELF